MWNGVDPSQLASHGVQWEESQNVKSRTWGIYCDCWAHGFALLQGCRDAAIQSSFTGANKAVWKQCLGRNYSASLNADAQDPELPSGWDLLLVCVINPVRCLMSLALKEPRNEGLFPKQWILFFKETIYISFLVKNQRKILRFYRSCKTAAPPLEAPDLHANIFQMGREMPGTRAGSSRKQS